ncbi:MoaD/ThiS family protein [Curtobacterium sp. Leaf261]|uniref:MoaD/ThiS family protein n=1 Tax=Curtobacterium sp. Leaf261 TaxID=1736311 RepID=UPI000AB1887F|nr:MoaD/ThiS family protein [Curtobacterium sp. Leaf261]
MRFFAAARAAVGVSSMSVPVSSTSVPGGAVTLGSALGAVVAADPARWESLQERCSYLVDGVTTRDRSASLVGVELVDVMPPFAGG